MKKALIIGIDNYPDAPLTGCVNDAKTLAHMLRTNWDGSPNFSVRLIVDGSPGTTSAGIQSALGVLFRGDAETALFYFAGHGIINEETNSGYIVSRDGRRGGWGVSLSEILGMANGGHPRIKSTVIILDSCHAGYAGELSGLPSSASVSALGNGVTILTACHREEMAGEIDGHGLFTAILLDGLSGSAADVCGRITPAALYSLIDQTLGPWEQRPIYKANVQTFVTLREVAPRVPLEVLRRLPTHFPSPNFLFQLDPSFEPHRENATEDAHRVPVSVENAKVFHELQLCNRHGLIVPVGEEHMYFAAIKSKACKLTAAGVHYRRLAELGRI